MAPPIAVIGNIDEFPPLDDAMLKQDTKTGSRRIAYWLASRLLEILAGAVVLLIVLGRSNYSRFPGLAGDLLGNGLLILFFDLASGYIASAVYFGFLVKIRSAIAYAVLFGTAWLVHFMLFQLLIGKTSETLLFGASGFCLVAVINYLTYALSNRQASPSEHVAQ
jgi:hypothetical protein